MTTRIRYEVEVEHTTIMALANADFEIFRRMTGLIGNEKSEIDQWHIISIASGRITPAVKAQEEGDKG